MVCRQGAALFFSAKLCGEVFAFHEFYLSPFVQALPLLFDSENAFGDMDSADSEMRRDVHGGFPESLHLLVGFDEDGSVRCALGPSYLFDVSLPDYELSGAQELAFAKEVLERPYPFGAGLMQFLLTIARGTYALPLAAVRKARRFARDDDRNDSTSSPAAPNDGDGSGDSGAANGGTEPSDTPFSDRLKFYTSTCNMQWHFSDRKVSPRARVGKHTILVSTFLMSSCFRAVCRCAQGKRHLVGEESHVKLMKEKNKQKPKEEFASELVWLPVVVTARGDLTTYDQPGDSFVRVTYLDQIGDDRTKRHPGWLMDKASLRVSA